MNERERLPWSRATTLALAAFAAAAALSTIWLVHPWYEAGGNTNDGSMYVLCAQALLRGEGYSYLGFPFTLRPPGFSALLTPVLALRGLDFHALNLFVALWGVACVALLAAFQRARLGTALALSAGALVWLNPLFQAFCCRVMSDVPAAAALAAGLLVERWARRRESWQRDVVLGVAIGLTGYLRWVDALLLAAVVGSRVARRIAGGERGAWLAFAARRIAPLTLAALAVMAPWWLRNALAEPRAAHDQEFAYSYATALFREDPGDPTSAVLSAGAVAQRVTGNLERIATAVGSRLRSPEGATRLGHGLLGALVLALALAALVRRRGAADFMLLGLLCAYAMAPSLRQRYLLPIFLLALPAALDTLAWFGARHASPRAVRGLLALLVLVLAGLDFAPRRGWEEIEQRHARFAAGCAAIEAALPPDAVLAAPIGWHLSLYLQRPVFNLAPTMTREKRMDASEVVFDRYRVNTVVAADFAFGGEQYERYLSRQYGPGRAAGEARLYRVRR